MSENILELNGLSVEILEQLSYESRLGISIKKNLHYFEKDALITELSNVSEWYDEQAILEDVALDYRVKSIESIISKYDRYYPDAQTRKVFNDILGFRAFCDTYDSVINLDRDKFRVADMSKGKANDDGYRGVHVYFQKNSKCYPIEIQFNTLYDRQLNNWLHEYLYKKNFPTEVGKKLRYMYETGEIRNEKEFEEALKNVLSSC
ncbi:MAG: hypothetical protein Q4F98_02510 [Lachnospiraceae bacterium]|nr:hypothetical protein [Lachnospiraceae bacterium]